MIKSRKLELLPHPSYAAAAQVSALYTNVSISGSVLRAEFEYESEKLPLIIPGLRNGSSPSRADELWKTTCFELFLQPLGKKNYWEVNFSPRGDWNVYSFEDYRAGMGPEFRIATVKLEQLESNEKKTRVVFSADFFGLSLRHFELRIGVTAVLETADGAKTYWAIKHASDKPDFHKPESFTHRAMIGM
jgi:hypothetical protein